MKNSSDIQLAIQFLEPCPQVIDYDPVLVKEKLQTAFSILPISIVIIGWDIPEDLIDICREETHKRRIKLYRWQPLLTSDGLFPVNEEFRVIGLNGKPVPGFKNMPSFTFMCPNNKPYREQLLEHIAEIIHPGKYDGIFLDRMRFPALTHDLNTSLACFCPSCQNKAEKINLDLVQIRFEINKLISTFRGRIELLQTLFAPNSVNHPSNEENMLKQYFAFRAVSISEIVNNVAKAARSCGAEVGLDCFSPTVSWSVGQDMVALDKIGDWIKPMGYLHTFAPAGLPFELNEMLTFLGDVRNNDESENLEYLSQITGLPLPKDQKHLMGKGLDSHVLTKEIEKAKRWTLNPIFEGIELVELPGITWIDQGQLQKDIKAILDSEADGVVVSWDLWHIKAKHLQTLAEFIHSPTV